MITPTVGRVVDYWPGGLDQKRAGHQPNAATIAYVHSDRCINIGYLDVNGNPGYGVTSVKLLQNGDEIPESGDFCEWMQYQKGQAAKTEAAERKLAAQAVGENELRGPEEKLASV